MHLTHGFVDALPGDPDRSTVSRQVYGAAYSEVDPTPVADPELVASSPEVAALLEVDPEAELEVLAGNLVPEGARPWAACYGGHQFGSWAGQLGDGRAIVLGERRGQEVQLKGAGRTPYSRGADGRAVLRSSIREFLCSEAMAHLGIPTTRALALVATGEGVLRDMFYDGRARHEPGAIVTRVAPSFLRLGSYQLPTARRDHELLRKLVHHTLVAHFPDLDAPTDPDALGPDHVLPWLHDVMERSAELVAGWQAVGFTHGVLNTDNLSILGLTIDYGPYGWLEGYDPAYTPNTSDHGRRYAYGQQPHVVGWNLARLCEAVLPICDEVPRLQEALDHYGEVLSKAMTRRLRAKLGLVSEHVDDAGLLDALPGLLSGPVTDWTRFHRRLSEVDPSDDDVATVAPIAPCFYDEPTPQDLAAWADWLRRWHRRTLVDHGTGDARRVALRAVNPRIVLRNWIVQEAIEEAEGGEYQAVRDLLEAVRTPFAEAEDAYDRQEPAWARDRPGCSRLSCSS